VLDGRKVSLIDDRNVIDFERRAAQVRAKHAGYLLTEQDGATPKGICDLVFYA